MKTLIHRLHITLSIFFILSYFLPLKAQHKDSLIQIVKQTHTNDSLFAHQLFSLAKIYYGNNNYDSALWYCYQSAIYAQKSNALNLLAENYKTIGGLYEIKGDYTSSSQYLFKALQLAEKIDNKNIQASTLLSIGILYFDIKDGKTAMQFYEKAAKIARKNNDTIMLIKILNNMGNACMTLLNDIPQAAACLEQSVEASKNINYEIGYLVGLNNLTEIYRALGNLDKAEAAAKIVLDKVPDNAFTLYNLGGIYKAKNKYTQAIKYYEQSLSFIIAEPELKQIILKEIAETHSLNNNYQQAYFYIIQYNNLKDSIHKIQSEKAVNEIKTKYEVKQHQEEIEKLNIEKRTKNIIIYSLIAGIILTCIIIIFILLYIINRRKIVRQKIELQQQKIRELEKDKQLIATNAVLEGEEEERKRVARDLHDGLGGLLSGVKISLNNLKSDLIISEQLMDGFKNSINLLDQSISELRRVAHNMMPAALIKYGLKQALQEFCSNLNHNKQSQIHFQHYGNVNRLNHKLELTIFRSIQELVNNSLKHAQAQNIYIQLVQDENRVHFTVQDDGKGFETKLITMKTGIGLANIKHRIEVLNGNMEIYSVLQKGTEINAEFLI